MKLLVNHNGSDYSRKMESFASDSTAFDFLGDLTLLVGAEKPLSKIYVEMVEFVPVSDAPITVAVWDGSSFVAIAAGVEDYTNGLTQSGFISWPESVVQKKQDINDGHGPQYWVSITIGTDAEVLDINGINLVLSTDKDLSFVPNVSQYLPTGSTSFIAFHEEARNIIVQMLRNSGKRISNIRANELIDTRQVSQFDLLNIEEFKNASKYLALHLIFDQLSKSDDDHFRQKASRYYDRFTESFNTNLVSIDLDNDGITDQDENQTVQFIRIIRE